MELVKSVFKGSLQKMIRRHSLLIAANFTSSIGLGYLWINGYRCLAPMFSTFCLGGNYWYARIKAKEKMASNQAIVITGCDSGLGYSLALHCRLLGAKVIAGVLKNDSPGARNLREKDIFVYQLDITDKDSVANFASSVLTLLNKDDLVLRCLINNAGVMIFGEFEWQTEDQIRSQVEVNFLGTMRITRELMPIIRRHSSRIIVISSHCNIEPLPGVAAYGATKAAINAWATSIRVELKKYGIKVVCFVPGSFTRESNILSRQTEHFEIMKSSMPEETKNFYGDYFVRYAEYFSCLAQEIQPNMIENERLYDIFEDALLDKHPSAVYKCEPWRYFFYHTLFKISPTNIRDRLIERFVQLPPWNGGKIDKTQSGNTCFPRDRGISRTSETQIREEDYDMTEKKKSI